MIELVDTHCHIHDSEFSDKFEGKDPDIMVREAADSGVKQLICVGTNLNSSKQAMAFCKDRENCHASLALHPHEASDLSEADIDVQMEKLQSLVGRKPKYLVAIGETGLDYYYHDDQSIRARQVKLLKQHIEHAIEFDLPLIFHVRDAFDDFFRIFDLYQGLRGVVHSFSATKKELDGVIERGLHIGLNGITTFTKNNKQLEAVRSAPLEKIVLETDAPFLTPVPLRGKMCEPKHVALTAEFLSKLRGENLEEFALATTRNAHQLFGL